MISNIIIGLFLGLGCFTFVAIVYFLIIAITDKIKRKTAEKRRLKKLDGKIDKINRLIREIQIEHDKFLVGKAYNRAMHKWIYLHEIQEVELSDKEIK